MDSNQIKARQNCLLLVRNTALCLIWTLSKLESRGLSLKLQLRNLGVVIDQFFNVYHHITAICKTSQYHLRNIARIRKYLDAASTETLVHAFFSSKLNHCNALIHGLPKYQLNRLQFVQQQQQQHLLNYYYYYYIMFRLIRK